MLMFSKAVITLVLPFKKVSCHIGGQSGELAHANNAYRGTCRGTAVSTERLQPS